MKSKIAISILHYKKPRLTVDCLESIKKQEHEDYHVYLLIQGAEQEDYITLHNVYDQWDKITIIDSNTNEGFAEGNNILIRKALEDEEVQFIVTLNNDTVIESDFLTNIIKPFTNQEVGLVQSKMMQMDNPKEIDNLGIQLMMTGLTFNIKNENKIMFSPSAGATCYSRRLLESIGFQKQVSEGFNSFFNYDYFDSEYFAYAEDLDLGFRALNAGFQPTYESTAICYHKGSASTSVMSDFAIEHTYRNVIWTLYKNLPNLLLIKYGFFIFIGHIMLLFNFLIKGKAGLFWNSVSQGIKRRGEFNTKRKQIITNSKVPFSDIEKYITKQLIDKDYI